MITGTSIYPSGATTSTYNYNENGPNGPRFTAVYGAVISGLGTSGSPATLSQSIRVNNPGSTPLNIRLFNLVDWAVGGSSAPGGTVTGNANAITVDGGLYRGIQTAVTPVSAFQVSENPVLDNLLTNSSIDVLNNSGLGMTYFSAESAVEWDLSVPASSFSTVGFDMSIQPAVPEPSVFAFTAAAGIGFAWSRWRSYRRGRRGGE